MLLEEASAFTEKCFTGEPASCSHACPFHLDVRSMLEKAARQKWNTAYKTYRNAVRFPVVVQALCPRPCEGKCQRTVTGDEPIGVREVETACVNFATNKKVDSYAIPPKDQSIAIIGAGPAGLACALDLAGKKYNVTVYDSNEGWGGHLRSHEHFEAFDQDFSLQFSKVNIDFRYGVKIDDLAELSEYDAVYVVTGKDGNDFGLKAGWNSDTEYSGAGKVFLGGELCGRGEVESIAASLRTARVIEGFVQTGRAELGHDEYNYCDHKLAHEGAEKAPKVIPADGAAYTKDEAAAEAARCLQCDCTLCAKSCELLASTPKKPGKMAVEVYTDSNANPPIATHELTRVVYSCNDCGHCKSICPESVDIGALLRFSREDRFGKKAEPKALHWFWLREMDFATGDAAYCGIPEGGCEYMFFPGCQLGASQPEHVIRSFDFLSSKHKTGIMLGCCGAPAYWAGDKTRREKNSEYILKMWESAGKPAMVFACATCENIFEKFLPEIPRITLYELMNEDGLVPSDKAFAKASVFDPCAARANENAQSAVRQMAQKAGSELEELKEKGRCCGYGGQMKTANPKLYEQIATNRSSVSDNPYIVWCANCKEVFLSHDKECAHILDVAFGLESGSIPSFETKRRNSIAVKDAIMRKFTDTGYSPDIHPWDDIKVSFAEGLERVMDNSLITESDVKETIWYSNNNAEKFRDPDKNTILCRMVTEMLTYWVEYRLNGDVYEVIDAYAHRMHFKEGV